MTNTHLPILYSFRRCPYAMRARMALKYSGCAVYLREVALRDKPAALLQCSAKGTVPVLALSNQLIIDESREIMQWALSQNDPEHWLPKEAASREQAIQLIDFNDGAFKHNLDRYKYPDRYPEQQAEHYRTQGEAFLAVLENQLSKHQFLMDNHITIADIGIFPFIRQFAHVDFNWFEQTPYPHLQVWVQYFIQSALFNSVMEKYLTWQEHAEPIVFA